jgi:hypothetical protein
MDSTPPPRRNINNKDRLALKLNKLKAARKNPQLVNSTPDELKNYIRSEKYREKYNIIEVIRLIQADFYDNHLNLEEITLKYPEFVRDYAGLANMATSKQFTDDDYNTIQIMLDKRQAYWDGKCSAEDAHAEISFIGASRYQPALLNKNFVKRED